MNRIWKDKTSAGSQRLVLLALADRADEDGICWPGVDWIAAQANITSRQIRTILRCLESSGDLITIGQKGGRHRTNLYIITTGLDKDAIAELFARCTDIELRNPEVSHTKPGSPASQNPEVQRHKTRKSSAETRKPSVLNPEVAASSDPLEPIEPPIKPPVVTAADAAIPTPAIDRTDRAWASICTVYENEIGLLTPTIADQLDDLAQSYPHTWITDAIREAAKANVRKINYAIAILKRWTQEGKSNHANHRSHRSANSEQRTDPQPENIYNQLLGWTTP